VDDKDFPIRYAFALDNILFISLDATMVGPLPSEQKNG
jgi:hypothetical protein